MERTEPFDYEVFTATPQSLCDIFAEFLAAWAEAYNSLAEFLTSMDTLIKSLPQEMIAMLQDGIDIEPQAVAFQRSRDDLARQRRMARGGKWKAF